MTTKSAFNTALDAALSAPQLDAETFTATNAANSLTITGHGYTDGFGPVRLSSTGQLPAELNGQKATNGLTFTPGAIADDVVEVAGVYYQFAADPTTGTPDGSVGTPYLVDVGVDDTASLANLLAAINASGTGGVTYSEEITTAHATVEATASDATTLSLRARDANDEGNFLTLSVSGNDGIAADAATFSGGTDAIDYYVRTVDANTINVALTAMGSAVAFTDDGTGTHTLTPTIAAVEAVSMETVIDTLSDAIETFAETHLTAPGNRANDPNTNLEKMWSYLIAQLGA